MLKKFENHGEALAFGRKFGEQHNCPMYALTVLNGGTWIASPSSVHLFNNKYCSDWNALSGWYFGRGVGINNSDPIVKELVETDRIVPGERGENNYALCAAHTMGFTPDELFEIASNLNGSSVWHESTKIARRKNPGKEILCPCAGCKFHKHEDSHVDHVSEDILEYVLGKFRDRREPFKETFILPERFGTVECSLYGPTTTGSAVPEVNCVYAPRGNREYLSRIYLGMEPFKTRTITVIAGPYKGRPCVLYTIFGGPIAPKEVNDPTLTPEEREESIKFWSKHALCASLPT